MESSFGHLGSFWGSFGFIQGVILGYFYTGSHIGSVGGSFEIIWGLFRVILWVIWSNFGGYHFGFYVLLCTGPILANFRSHWGHFWVIWLQLRRLVDHLCDHLGSSISLCWVLWGYLVLFGGHFGLFRGPFGLIQEIIWDHIGVNFRSFGAISGFIRSQFIEVPAWVSCNFQ